jgi:hypothetical protein
MKVCGMTLKKKGNIISQCLNNGFIYNNYYFIDLDTFDKGERNNGYGTFVSYKLICSELKKVYCLCGRLQLIICHLKGLHINWALKR